MTRRKGFGDAGWKNGVFCALHCVAGRLGWWGLSVVLVGRGVVEGMLRGSTAWN